MDDDSDEMVFPLTSQQNSTLCAWIPPAILHSKDKECQMALKIHAGAKAAVHARHLLERRLGVLMTYEEIAQIRKEIAPPKMVESTNAMFFDDMIRVVSGEEGGVKCVKYLEGGASEVCFLVVCGDRLYWKENKEDAIEEKESMHLSEIVQVRHGKGQRTPDDVDADFCFSVVTKEETCDYLMQTCRIGDGSRIDVNDPLQVRKYVTYLNGLCRHFTVPCVRHLKDESVDDKAM